ncbi:MAG TPA: glycosyltransferase family 4 protein [Patescibacteria group bacterium]|nr:glycosyltransferase family 4 protein [Patescibacteria group bacterium]
MKKTLLITLEYPPQIGGVSQYYHHLIHELPKDSVIVLHNQENKLLFNSLWIWPRWLKGLWNSIQMVKQHRIEHILVGQILPIGTIAFIIYVLYGIPYTVMTHAMDITVPQQNVKMKRKQRLIKKILHYAHSITTVSRYTRSQLEQLDVPRRKIFLVYPCPHTVSSAHENSQNEENHSIDTLYPAICNRRILLSVGRLVERKGMDMAIIAMSQIRKNYPTSLLVIVGEGSYRFVLERIVHVYQLEKNVLFVGAISDKELKQWYERSELFILPSRELKNKDVEGFGIVFLEANSFGKPVIGGKSGGIPDAVIDGKTGFLVDPNDDLMLIQAIRRLLDNPAYAKQLGEQGRARVAELFQWKKQSKLLEELLKKST